MAIKNKAPFEHYAREIGESFNFEKVHKAMMALGWQWSMGEKHGFECYGIPTLETIKNFAFSLLKEAYNDETNIGSGGFSTGWEGSNMFLCFTIEEEVAYNIEEE